MKLIVEIFIGDVKEDQIELIHQNDVEPLREIKRKYSKLVSEKINNGEWRQPKFAGEFAVSLRLLSKQISSNELQNLENKANTIY